MKLNELVGVKKFANMTHNQVVDWLIDNASKFQPLGDGVHAVALTDGTDVYKFWMVDAAYERFVRYALNRQDNPFLPRFKSKPKTIPAFFVRHKDAPDTVRWIKMEMLKPVRMKGRVWALYEDLFARMSDGADPMDAASYFVDDGEEQIPNVMKLAETLDDIVDLGFELDLHRANVMMRGEQLVLLDPIADFESVDLNDDFADFASSVEGSRGIAIGKAGSRRTK